MIYHSDHVYKPLFGFYVYLIMEKEKKDELMILLVKVGMLLILLSGIGFIYLGIVKIYTNIF